ncbi:hypothetical protein M4R22_17845 [Acidovorax sp. GBBC 3334]|uniref:hypothetical protein n=1 Tax=unclassified Acidovorax TaxID=2684926 RepID=UPI002302F3D5|nr:MULTISPECIES: hypothetical protein [unclassified Acidovorax]MDA8456626.1 hypothetical protein [Acidovorax sp. GBBC 3334]MDA8522057.1 hypothetical protein [Acidovorax sp. NCPPB 4044]
MTRAAARGRLCAVLLAGVAALLALETWAAPAPWHYWRSKVDGRRVCAQTSPGPGWERDSPPYDGPNCTAPRKVFVIPMR